MTKRTKVILSLVILLLILIVFIFYEIRYKPDADWRRNFDLNSEEPFGTKLFCDLIKAQNGEDNVLYYSKDFYFDSILPGDYSYIYIADRYVSYEKADSIIDFIRNGDDAMIIAGINFMHIPIDSSQLDTINIDSQYNVRSYIEASSIYDSIINYKFVTKQDTSDIYNFEFYTNHFWNPKLNHFNFFIEQESDSMEFLAYMQDTSAILARMKFDSNYLYVHLIPDLISNVASRQKAFLPHFNHISGYLTGKKILLDHPMMAPKEYFENINKSPLSYILSQRSLRWAYYIILMLLLLYLFIGGKRKFKAVDLLEKNENTSIEYIKIQSELYRQQEQHEKLINQMRSNFYYWVKSRYFIEKLEQDFAEKLSRKSKVEKTTIDRLLNKLNNNKIDDLSDDQLIVLNKQIESLKSKAK